MKEIIFEYRQKGTDTKLIILTEC